MTHKIEYSRVVHLKENLKEGQEIIPFKGSLAVKTPVTKPIRKKEEDKPKKKTKRSRRSVRKETLHENLVFTEYDPEGA